MRESDLLSPFLWTRAGDRLDQPVVELQPTVEVLGPDSFVPAVRSDVAHIDEDTGDTVRWDSPGPQDSPIGRPGLHGGDYRDGGPHLLRYFAYRGYDLGPQGRGRRCFGQQITERHRNLVIANGLLDSCQDVFWLVTRHDTAIQLGIRSLRKRIRGVTAFQQRRHTSGPK